MYTGGMKSYETKIFKTEIKGSTVAFVLAGIQDYGLMAIQNCQKALLKSGSKRRSMDDIQDLISSTLMLFFKHHTEMQPEDQVELIIGAWTKSDGLRLLSTRKAAVVERPQYECKGSGSYLARYLVDSAYQPAMTLQSVTILAMQVLAGVKSYDEYCGGASELIVLDASGSLSPIAHDEIGISEKYISAYEKHARRFMFDFANPHMKDEDFLKRLGAFVEGMKAGREGWKEATKQSRAIDMVLKELGLT
jgi:20S proteasome alpha/beta subunit